MISMPRKSLTKRNSSVSMVTGAVTLIQRFGGALNLNVHLHMLFVDGVYIEGRDGSLERFRWVRAPTRDELTRLSHTIARRVGRYLERQGLVKSDTAGRVMCIVRGSGLVIT
mgnify:CR=1 FL=1